MGVRNETCDPRSDSILVSTLLWERTGAVDVGATANAVAAADLVAME